VEKISISIPAELYEQIQRRVSLSHGEFKDVEEYVEFVLREILKGESNSKYTTEEERQVKERLKSLGYL